MLQTYDRFPLVVERGEGSKLYDPEGNQYIDMTSGIGVSSLGYNHAKLKAAMTEQMNKLFHTSNVYYNSTNIKLADKLTSLSGMTKTFLCNSGAEANEGAIKIARKYGNDKYEGKRHTILTLKNSFHGRTITTLEATGQDKYHQHFFPFTQGFKYVEMDNIQEFEQAVDESICAVLLEAIQGEGGIHPASQAFINSVEKICKDKDILLIFDEIQSGIGRTGKFFAYEEFGVKPDLVTCAKGLGGGVPIGAILCNEKTSEVLNKGDHGSTFGGNPISAACALAVLDTIGNEDFLSEVGNKSKYIFEKLAALSSNRIIEVRGRGLMIGVELECEAKGVILECIQKGVLFLSAGKNVVRMLPPLIISYEEIDAAIQTLGEALKAV